MNLFKRIKDWWTWRGLTKDFDKEVDQNVNMWSNSDVLGEVQEDQEIQQKYYNGITLMKRRLKEMGTPLDRFMGQKDFYVGNDLLSLAKDETADRKALAEVRKAALVYEGADVKTAEDKSKMIDKRIMDYHRLQNIRASRELNKQMRQAYREGNLELHKQLEQEWYRLYGKSGNSQKRH